MFYVETGSFCTNGTSDNFTFREFHFPTTITRMNETQLLRCTIKLHGIFFLFYSISLKTNDVHAPWLIYIFLIKRVVFRSKYLNRIHLNDNLTSSLRHHLTTPLGWNITQIRGKTEGVIIYILICISLVGNVTSRMSWPSIESFIWSRSHNQ